MTRIDTHAMKNTMLPIVICKIFEDNKNSIFEERYHCLQFFRIWLKYSDINFPIIFPQALASISKTDDIFKIGCIEFLREMSIIRPDLCSTVGGFNILITSLLDENLPKNILINIKNFNIVDKFKQMIIKYLINTMNGGDEINIYKNAFYALNYYHNGWIEPSELKKGYMLNDRVGISYLELQYENIKNKYWLQHKTYTIIFM